MNLAIHNETDRASLYGYSAFQGRMEAEGQLRIYYFQKSQIRKGKASDNLSGLYIGIRFGSRWDYENFSGRETYAARKSIAGISAGYQQRLFHKLYFDSAVNFSGVGFDRKFVKVRNGELNARAGVGFAF